MNEKVICKNCGEENYADDIFCSKCKVRISESIPKHMQRVKGEGYIDATKVIAWIELVSSCYMAIQSWSKAGKINEYLYDNIEIANQLKNSMEMSGVYFLLGGIILFILLMAVHYIGKNVIEIRRDMNK